MYWLRAMLAPQTLVDKLKATDPAEHGRTVSTLRLWFEIKRLMLADSAFRFVSHLANLTEVRGVPGLVGIHGITLSGRQPKGVAGL
jgi:hypothetical protein